MPSTCVHAKQRMRGCRALVPNLGRVGWRDGCMLWMFYLYQHKAEKEQNAHCKSN